MGACVSSYQWTYPSGYTVSGSSSGASIVLVPSGTPDDAGTIRATATLSCGNTFTKDYKITFNATPVGGNPYISGPLTFCSGSGGIYTVSPLLAGATISWVVTGGTLVNGQGTPTAFVSSKGYGNITIQANITTSCGTFSTPPFSVFVNAAPGTGITYTSNNGAVQPLLYYYSISDMEEEIVNVNVNGLCLGYTSRGVLSFNASFGSIVTFAAVK